MNGLELKPLSGAQAFAFAFLLSSAFHIVVTVVNHNSAFDISFVPVR
jgi:hypothetical protein